MFVWVLLFRKWIATASVGTYICGVLVNDGYLYRVRGGRLSAMSLGLRGLLFDQPPHTHLHYRATHG